LRNRMREAAAFGTIHVGCFAEFLHLAKQKGPSPEVGRVVPNAPRRAGHLAQEDIGLARETSFPGALGERALPAET
jgi:hypothetical protein